MSPKLRLVVVDAFINDAAVTKAVTIDTHMRNIYIQHTMALHR